MNKSIKAFFQAFFLFLYFIFAPTSITFAAPVVESVAISGDKLIVTGHKFLDIDGLILSDPQTCFKKPFKVESATESEIVGRAVDNQKITVSSLMNLIIDTAKGETTYPVSFNLQKDAVTNPTIKNGAITPDKFIGVTTANPPDQTVPTWSAATNSFVFTKASSGGGSSGVSEIVLGSGIIGAPNTASGSVPISVDTGNTGDASKTKIPYFNSSNKIVLDSTNSPTGALSGLSLKDGTKIFDIFNDNALRIDSEAAADLLVLDVDGNLSLKGPVTVGGFDVCLSNGNCIPSSGLTLVTATAPLVAAKTGTGTTNISAGAVNTANNLVQLDGTGTFPSTIPGVVRGPGSTSRSATSGNLAIFSDTSGENLGDGGIGLQNLVTMTATPTTANKIIISTGSSKVLGATSYTIPNTSGVTGQVLGITATDTASWIDAAGVESFNGRIGAVTSLDGDYTASQVTNLPFGIITALTVQQAIDQLADLDSQKLPKAGGVMTGTITTSTQNAIKIGPHATGTGEIQFIEPIAAGSNYVGFKAPANIASNTVWTLPSSDGTSGQVLATNGSSGLSWTSPGGGGDVVGPSSSTSTNLATFNGTTGKLIQDSGISSNNLVTMSGTVSSTGNVIITGGGKIAQDSNIPLSNLPIMPTPAIASNTIILSAGNSKDLISTPYTIPPNIGSATYVLKSDGTNVQWGPDASGTGDVSGPPNSLDQAIPSFSGTSGKVLQNTLFRIVSNTLVGPNMAMGENTEYGTSIACFSQIKYRNSWPSPGFCQDSSGGAHVKGELHLDFSLGGNSRFLIEPTQTTNKQAFVNNGNFTVGTNILFVDTITKSVGIGTTSPIHALQIDSTNSGFLPPRMTTAQKNLIVGTPPGLIVYDTDLGSLNVKNASGWLSLAGGTGDVAGPATATLNSVARFESGKVIKNSGITIDDANNISGINQLNGIVVNNLITGSGLVGNLPIFGILPSELDDSGIALINIPTMVAPAIASNTIILSAGNSKDLKSTPYTIPPNIGSATYVLKSDGTNVQWGPDASGTGDVSGPPNSLDQSIPTFSGTTGKILQGSLFKINGQQLNGPNVVIGENTAYGDYVACLSHINYKDSWASPGFCQDSSGGAHMKGEGNLDFSLGGTSKFFIDATKTTNKQALVNQGNFTVGTNILFVDTLTRSVGIGTTSPTNALQIDSTVSGFLPPRMTTAQKNLVGFPPQGLIVYDTDLGSLNVRNASGWVSLAGGTGDVVGPATATLNSVARYESGKVIKESGIIIDDANNISGINQINGIVVNNLITGTGLAGNLSIFGTLPSELEDSGIASINIPTMASNATAAFHPILSGGANKTQIAAPYTFPNTACLAGEVLKWNATGFTCQADFGGTGNVAGPATSSSNTLAQFSDSTGKIIKGTSWTVPNSIGLPGQFLTVSGATDLNWTSLPTSLVQVGGAPVVADNLSKFGGTDGTQIIDSGIATANVPTMLAAATSLNTVILSGGADKTLKSTAYTIPSTIGSPNFVLKSDGTNATWQADEAGTGDVAGPATATLNSVARYESGKVIKESGIIIDDANNISGVAQLNTKLANNLVTGTGIGVDRNLPVYSGMSPTEIEDSGISLDNIATMSTPSNAVGNILTSAGLDKSITDSGIALSAIPRLASPTGSPNKILLSADSNSGIKTSNYTVPPNIGSATYILKSDGTNAQWAPDASGTGDVMGPASAASTNLAAFNGTTGKLIADSGVAAANVVTSDNNFSAANRLALSAGNNKKLSETGYTVPQAACSNGEVLKFSGGNLSCAPDTAGTGDVAGPATATLNSVARYESGKVIKESGIIIDDANNISGINQLNGIVVNNLVTGGGLVGNLPIFGLFPSELEDSGIPLANIPNMASNATAAFHPILSAGNNKSQIAAPYTFPNTACLAGEVLKWNATGFTCQADFGGTGNVAGPATSSSNTLAQFSDSSGKIIKGTAWTVPNNIGLPGQFLTVAGAQDLMWTSFPTTLVYVGGAPVVVDNLPKFGGSDGTQIIDSGIATINVPTMVAAAPSSNTIILSNGADKALKTTDYTIPSIIGSPNFVLKSDGTNATWQADVAGTGDVAGPATATLNSIARYESGKVIKESGIIIDDANNISGINQLNGITLNNFITGSGLVGNLPIFGLLPSELDDSGIALINIPTMASNATAGFQPILSAGLNKSQIAAPYTLPNTACLAGEVLKWNATGFTCQTDASGSGDVAGPATATPNSIARYESGKVIKNSGILIDDANNISGVAQLNTKVANNLVTGTGIGVGRNLPMYVGMSPTEIQDSGISLDNIATMATSATAQFHPILSGGNNKTQVAAPYTLPNTTCLPGEVLKWNTTGFTCQADIGGSGSGLGDVTGPASATINSVPLFADSSGKVLKATDYTIPNIICPIGQVLKSDGTNMTCQADVNGLTEWVAGKNYKAGEIVNTGSDANWLFKVVQDHTSVDVPADFRAGKIMAIAPPIITTGVQDGGGISLAGNVATVQGGTGYIAKYGTSPSAWPLITIVEWTTQTITLPSIGIYTLFIDESGGLIFQTGVSTIAAQDNTISVGIIDMTLGTAHDRKTYPTNPVGQLRGLAFFFGGMTKGLSYTPSVTKELARTAYDIYFWGANYVDPYSPNTKSYNAKNPVQFYEFTQFGPVLPSSGKTQLRNVWDNNGTLTDLGGSRWGFARIYSTLGEEDYIMYSQDDYGEEKDARAAAIDTSFITPPELALTKFSSWMVFKGSDDDFSDNSVTTCEPFGCDKIGSAAGGGVGGGDVLGPVSSLDNSLALFSGVSGKTLKSTPYTFPITSCPPGEVLKSDGTNFICGLGTGLGDVVGPASSGTDTLASFDGTTGKLIKDSGIASAKIVTMDMPSIQLGNVLTTGGGNQISDSNIPVSNLPTMGSPAISANTLILSAGNSRDLKTTLFTIPPTIGSATFVLKSNGTNVEWAPDEGGVEGAGDVIGPVASTNNSVALFSDNSGKVLKTTGYTIPNSVCLNGEVLKSDGTNLTCQAESNRLTEWVAGKAYKAGEIVNTGSDANWLFKVITDHTSVDVPADFRAGKIMAIAPPIITTGVQDGGSTSLVGNLATVQGGTGYIAKYGASPSAWPLITIVEWATQNIVLPLSGIHSLFIDQNGTLKSVSGIGARSAQDDNISVGIVDMNLGMAYDRQTYPTNPVGQLRGLAFFFGGMTKGLNYTGDGLELTRTAHEVYYWGADNSNPYDPNSKDEPAISPVSFYEFTRSGPVLPVARKITLRNNVYDNNGTLTTMANNRWGFVRIYRSLGADDYVMYSQDQYDSESEAKTAAISPTFIKPVDLELTKFSSWFVFQKSDSDFANNPITVCEPFGCDKIGSSAGGGGGAGDVLGPVASLDNSLAQFSGVNGKTIKSTPYTFPILSCLPGEILKSDGFNFVCGADLGGTGSGDVLGPVSSITNRLAIFADATGKVLAQSAFSLPTTAGTLNQTLVSNGDGTTKWGLFSTAGSGVLRSDRKLKKEIKNLTEGYIERLMDLRPVSFVWRDTLNPDMGFIAQDVSKIFPGLVENSDDGLGINYSKLVVPIVKAFQEKVQKDEQTIKMLLDRIERLEKIIEAKK